MSEFPEVKDHLVANPDKYTMTTNPDGTVTLRPTWVDNPSEVLQEGTPVDAAFLQKIPEAIDAIDTKVTSQLAEKVSKAEVRLSTATQPINVNEMDTETRQLFTGGAVAVVGVDAVLKENIRDKQVGPDKTTFIQTVRKNIFDKTAAQTGIVNSSTGAISASTDFYTSGFMPATSEKTYYTTVSYNVAYYDAAQLYVGGATGAGTAKTLTLPANAKFIRITVQASALDTTVVSETPIAEFSPFGTYEIQVADQEFKKTINKSLDPISPTQTSFFRETLLNLFDKSKVTNPGIVSGSSGTVSTTTPGYVASDFIPVETGKTYNATTSWNCAYYDANKAFVAGVTGAGTLKTFTPPANARFVRLTFSVSGMETAMFVDGTLPTEYVAYGTKKLEFKTDQQKKDIAITLETEIKPDKNPLYGKIVAFNGDSVCFGAGEASGNRRAWAGRIAQNNNMIVENRAASGATITANTIYSDTGNPRHWISRDIQNMRADADYIILEGGTNDDGLDVPMGAITPNYVTAFDDTTFCGAFESMLKQAIVKYLGKKIGFILTYKMLNRHSPYGTSAPQVDAYFDKAREICEKWSVPYLDLYNQSNLTVEVPEVKAAYMPDGVHINEAGYDLITPKIEAWMKTL